MNIDDLEKNLNNYEVNPDRAIALILKTVANNQALLQTVLKLQIELIATLSKTDPKIVYKDVQSILEAFLAKVQADISSQI